MSDPSSSCNSISDDTSAPEWISQGGFFLLVLVVIQMFWGMAFICEEYSIPSITVFCKRNNISDDIAGSIYIGTGLSLPVLFVSFIGLFISNSAIGVGTVVGGDVFNHLINIGVSILASPGYTMKIDRLITTREVLCYMISCLMVLWAIREDLEGTLRTAFNHEQWVSCLDIPWVASFALVLSYVCYVIMESYFDSILTFFKRHLSRCVVFYQSPVGLSLLLSSSSSRNNSVADPNDLQTRAEGEGDISGDIECILSQKGFDNYITEDSGIITASTTTASSSRSGGGRSSSIKSTQSNFPAPSDENNVVQWRSNPYRPLNDQSPQQSIPPARRELSFSDRSADDSSTTSSQNNSSTNSTTSMLRRDYQVDGSGRRNTDNDQRNEMKDQEEIEIVFGVKGSRPQQHQQQQRHQRQGTLVTPRQSNASTIDSSNYFALESSRNELLFEINSTTSTNNLPYSSTQTGELIDENGMLLTNFTLFVRSNFYEKYDFGGCIPSSRKWSKRYFTFHPTYGLYYRLNDSLPMNGNHIRFINLFSINHFQYCIEDISQLEFSITLIKEKTVYYFRAPNHRILNAILYKLEQFQHEIQHHTKEELEELAKKAIREISLGSDSVGNSEQDDSVGGSKFIPPSSSLILLIFYYFTLPLKFCFYFTIPDVRAAGSEHRAIVSTLAGFIWLAILTYILVEALGLLSIYMNINAIIMGYTVGAWAASYPALWSSVVVARNGFADTAVCNALGSNVFSNFIGLGLPWFIYSIAYGENYSGIQDQGAAYSVLVLMLILTAFYGLLVCTNFALYYWMIPIFFIVYIAYTAYFIYFTINL